MFKNVVLFFVLLTTLILQAESPPSIAKEYSQAIVDHFKDMKHSKYLIEHEIDGRHYLFVADRGHNKPKAAEILGYVIKDCVPDHCVLFLEGSTGKVWEGVFGLEDQIISPLNHAFMLAHIENSRFIEGRFQFPYTVWAYPKLKEWWDETRPYGLISEEMRLKINGLIYEAEGRKPVTDPSLDPILNQAREISADYWIRIYRAILIAAYADPAIPEGVLDYLHDVVGSPPGTKQYYAALLSFTQNVSSRERSAIFVEELKNQLKAIPKDKLVVIFVGLLHYRDMVRDMGGKPLDIKMPSVK